MVFGAGVVSVGRVHVRAFATPSCHARGRNAVVGAAMLGWRRLLSPAILRAWRRLWWSA